ncbi:MAG: hypothetical protein IIA65_03020, partial [Planctomycetes bacterium]|nr:hypothetical protein [Planctomycetota bacterium]
SFEGKGSAFALIPTIGARYKLKDKKLSPFVFFDIFKVFTFINAEYTSVRTYYDTNDKIKEVDKKKIFKKKIITPVLPANVIYKAEDYHKGPLSFYDDQKKKHYIPYVIEPSAGMDRSTLAFLVDAYDEEEVKGQTRNVLRFHPALAPTKVAVFPLVKKEGMPDIAHNITDDLKRYVTAFYDEKGAIGRRYRRQDEAGTPYCITVDGDTLAEKTVTVRDRDSMEQTKVSVDQIKGYIRDKLDM